MGNFFAKAEVQQNQDWDHFLQQNQQNVLRTYQNDEPLPVINQKLSAETKEKGTYKVNINQYIEEKVKIEADPQVPNNFFVSMLVKNLTPKSAFEIKVHTFATVVINQGTELFEGIVYTGTDAPMEFVVSGAEYNLMFPFFLGNNSCKTNPGSKVFPIIVEILHKEGFSTIYKYTLEIKEEWAPHLVEKALVMSGKYTVLRSVFGLKNSSLSSNPNDEKCLICMTNSIDVMISPCNHMCLCSECTESLKSNTNLCPMCRRTIGSFVRMVLKNSTDSSVDPMAH